MQGRRDVDRRRSSPAQLCCVVSASVLEERFLSRLLRECAEFADLVVVTYADRLYSVPPEDPTAGANAAFFGALEQHVKRDVPAPERYVFVRYSIPDTVHEAVRDPVACHNRARIAGVNALDEHIDRAAAGDKSAWWVLLLDGDEVPEGAPFRAWWRATPKLPHVACKMANHWYFLLPTLRSVTPEDSVVLINRAAVTENGLHDARERDGVLTKSACSHVVHNVRGVGTPPPVMFHHYSWVRSRADLERKVACWTHTGERPWTEMLRDAWRAIDVDHVVPDRDFVHGHALENLPPEQNFLLARP